MLRPIGRLGDWTARRLSRLLVPDSAEPAQAFLAAGDTIVSYRKGSAMDAVAEVAAGLSKQVDVVLRQTNRTLLAVQATVGHAERSLAGQGLALAAENRADLRQTVTNLTRASRQLDNFAEEMSRRPYRLLTGVRPVVFDTVAPAQRADTTTGAGTRP